MLETLNATSGRIPATALFNKLNGELVSVSSLHIDESQHNPDYYIARPVMYNFATNGDTIEGNLIINKDGSVKDNFKVVAYADRQPTIYESQMNAMAAQKITKKYPLTVQLNVMAACLNKLGEEHSLGDSDEFQALNEMLSYINQCVQINKTKKEFYANDPDTVYISDEALAESLSRKMEGGIHEEIGPRNVTGGSIWS